MSRQMVDGVRKGEPEQRRTGPNPATKRYWPGRAPDWVEQQQQGESSDDEAPREAKVEAVAAPVVVKKVVPYTLARCLILSV